MPKFFVMFLSIVLSYVDFQHDLYKHKSLKILVTEPLKNNVSKIYCEKYDLVLESREKFDKHLDSHSSGIVCVVCPIDTVIAKFVNLFKRKSSRNLE